MPQPHSGGSPEQRPRRWPWVVLIAALLLLLWYLLAGHQAPQRKRPTVVYRPPSERVLPPRETGPSDRDPASRHYREKMSASRRAQPLKPIIDEVILEKTEVCRGEENLVTVKAHTPGHQEDEYLHYVIGHSTGRSAPIRRWGKDKDTIDARVRQVTVFGRDNVRTTAEIPYFKVKDCDARFGVVLLRRILPNTLGEYEIQAKIVHYEGAGKGAFVPVRYEWDFGDGKKQATRKPLVVHGYEQRAQDTLYSSILLRCTAVDKKGNRLTGRSSMQLLNPAFEQLHVKGIVWIMHRMDPRFPEADAQGRVEQTVLLFHTWPEPVRVTRILKTVQYEDPAQGMGAPEQVSAKALLRTDEIPPEGLEVLGVLDPAESPGVAAVRYTIFGRTPNGIPAKGEYTIMLPPERPTRDKHEPVTDPLLHAKIVKARQVLGKQFVTDEDLIRLGKLGYFDDLRVPARVRTLHPPSPPPK